ncbi:STAS/SEC14 domain-containing protein [uncultured Zoogloea sp.]|uniref:STAS/SEC14 domain-containing protein n=1 Tax=uncultured Zoogloea sp. TaxID=160237 RepID=UPI00262E7C55|nr:STAS/SEC14 domain-containing protein [uncultured Zoogloea sp.]
MITTDQKESRVNLTVFGEFTLADYKEFEEVVNYKVRFEGPVSLFFDLREMSGFTIDMALEEIRFARAHAHDFARIAILTDDQWVAWSAWLSKIFVDADVRVFEDVDDAEAWLSGIESPVA